MNRILIALPLLLCTTGCVEIPLAILAIDALSQDASQDDYGYDDYSYEDEYYSDDTAYDDGTYAPIEGLMAGQMAANGTFERPITTGEAWIRPDGMLKLEAHATGDAWAMVAVTIPLDALEHGVTATYGPGALDTIGCSGARPYEFAFDGPAIQTDVTVDPEPDGSLRLSVWADFGNGDHVTTVVVVPVPDAG